jgi:hypothetical protein
LQDIQGDRQIIGLGSIVSVDTSTDVGSPLNLWDSKVTNTLVLDREETKVWSSDKTRNEMQLAGILMAWVYETTTLQGVAVRS